VAVLLRFRDLKRYGIKNHPTLKRWIEQADFPPGFYLGSNTRAWREDDCEVWLANRPKWEARPPEIEEPAPSVAAEESGPVVEEDRQLSNTRLESNSQACSTEKAA